MLAELFYEWQSVMTGDCTAAEKNVNLGERDNNISIINDHHGLCAICLNKIALQETALVKGCEHAYWFVRISSYVFDFK